MIDFNMIVPRLIEKYNATRFDQIYNHEMFRVIQVQSKTNSYPCTVSKKKNDEQMILFPDYISPFKVVYYY